MVIGSEQTPSIRCIRRSASSLVKDTVHEPNEFIAPKPGDEVALLKTVLESPGDLNQHHVAGGVTIFIVYRLETVEIEQEDNRGR